ncbi:deoxyribose-phosphate aldolase [candidate division LCP-89 bacterium B3_LCP]|uniref:Deoxyribose-phosphate aldolase n=1 Tax=candidate division LCP-89 bacterium B3_LCP TaxID=2012998 RepID=A0A532UYQ7_UNCL8|nr:MAG: deoxyribose-phosphate aldolase [candidate division LCP-89 bacterium B3_LCP]
MPDDLISRIVSEVMVPGQVDAAVCGDSSDDCSACGRCVVERSESVDRITSAGADRISLTPGSVESLKSGIAGLIDHTLLKPDASEAQVKQLCEEARRYNFASVCVNPCWISLCAKLLEDTRVKICSVVGFPLGASHSSIKAAEATRAVNDGATELDMVANIGFIKSNRYEEVERDIWEVVKAANGVHVKVIIEACLLSDDEKVKSCLVAKRAGAAFVKTSTGFSTGGATLGDVALMRRVVGPAVGVKAAGGVKDLGDVLQMVEAGATRIGASASVAIVS